LRRRLVFHQFTTERTACHAVVRIKDRQRKCKREKYSGQPCGELHQHICGLRAENVLRDAAAKCCAQTFTLWSLHQYDKNHQGGDQYEEHQAKVDQQVHWEAKYGKSINRSKRGTSSVEVTRIGRWMFRVERSTCA